MSVSSSNFVETFKNFYGPTMNAFEAAEKNGKAGELQHELELLFKNQNKSGDENNVSIPAIFKGNSEKR